MLAAKLGFVHRLLWQRDRAYRWAVLLGPPPLLGCALAAAIWSVVPRGTRPSTVAGADAPWAEWKRPVPQEEQPFTEAPSTPLPQRGADGKLVGFEPGWRGAIHPMTVSVTMDADVSGSVVSRFTLDQPVIPLTRILDAGPPSGLFVGDMTGFVVVSTPGSYALSVRLARSSPQSANCLVRLGSARHRLLRNINMNVNGQAVLNYPLTEFQLQPGLFSVAVAAGCWRGDQMVGPGEVTLMIRHPGEDAPQPARADEVVRPVR